jgi:CBS domain-containing protein
MATDQTRVRDAMTESPKGVDPDMPVVEAARMMLADDVGSLPVVQGERLIGMLTDRDITTRVVAEEKDPASITVAGVATRQLVTVTPDAPLEEALRLMAAHQLRRLPVVEGEHRLVGILAQADIALAADEAATGEVVEQISQPDGRDDA